MRDTTLDRIVGLIFAEADRDILARFAAALTLVVAGGMLTALAPLALKGMVDALAAGGDAPTILAGPALALGVAYLLALCCKRLLTELGPWVYGQAEQRLYARLGRCFFAHVLDLRLDYHLNRRSGALVQTLPQALAGCQLLVAHLVNSVVPVIVELVAVAAILVTLDQPALVATFLVTAMAYLAIFHRTMRPLTRSSTTVSRSALDAQAVLADGLLNYETIKHFNAEAGVRARYAGATGDLEAQWGRLRGLRLRAGLAITATFALSMAFCLGLAAQATSSGALSIGGFVLVTVYMLRIVQPLEMLGGALRDLSLALGFVRPLLEVLSEPPEESQRLRLVERVVSEPAPDATARKRSSAGRQPEASAFSFEGVHFGYSAERQVLNGLSLELLPGRTVAVVGASGAGKSSLVRLMLRLYDPQRGRILLDSRPIDELPLAELRLAIGLVPQDTALFNGSIEYNIGIGKAGASRLDIERAARLAHLHELIASLPAGYDTVVGERGLKLSGGERQRIAIARAVIKRPRLYVFDEATSSLDSHTEAEIMRNLREVSAGCTTLMIAHRLSTVRHADEIVVIDGGQVVERGRHDDLLQREGPYRKLWLAQLPWPSVRACEQDRWRHETQGAARCAPA
jgi:ABC-type multidrug transport system fused ATPase/permease subunit